MVLHVHPRTHTKRVKITKRKERKEKEKKRKKRKEEKKKTITHGRVPRTGLLFAGTMSPLICPADGPTKRTSREDRREGKETRNGFRQRAKNKQKQQFYVQGGSRTTQQTQREQTDGARGAKIITAVGSFYYYCCVGHDSTNPSSRPRNTAVGDISYDLMLRVRLVRGLL